MAVIEAGGFARAAARLGVAKSIISRRITRLEADLGTRLLNRTTRGISPTDAGAEFSVRGQRALETLMEARAAVAAQRGEIVGKLRLSIPSSFGIRHMSPIFAALHAMHPRLELDVTYDDGMVDLLAGRFDAAVRFGRSADSALVTRRIATVQPVIVASPEYLAKKAAPKNPSDLALHECLVNSGLRERHTWRFRAGKKQTNFFPVGRFRANSNEGLIKAAEAGIGIAALPDLVVSDSIKCGRLVPLLIDYPLKDVALCVLRPPGALAPGKTRVLIDILVERFGSGVRRPPFPPPS